MRGKMRRVLNEAHKRGTYLLLTVVLIVPAALFGGCSMSYKPIENTEQAKEYILSELEKKYGEVFASDVEAEKNYSNEEKGYFQEYFLNEIYLVSDPSAIFGATCNSAGTYMVDNRATLLFKSEAVSLVNEALTSVDFLARWEVKVEMFDTAHTWKKGDSFKDFMGDGQAFDPWLAVWLYIKPGASNEEVASQIFHNFQEIYALGHPFHMRVCYEGEDIGRDCFFLYSTHANHFVYESEARVLEKVIEGLEMREFEKRYQEQSKDTELKSN